MQLQIIEHANYRVLTTPQLAEAFDSKANIISRNFQRNRDRYEEGVHYFALTGDVLKEFKAKRQDDVSLKFVSVLYLWTEQGAWMHAKSLNNDSAWKAYRALIDNYYAVVEQLKQPPNLAISYEDFKQIESRVEVLEKQLQEVTLHSGEQRRLRTAVTERVYQLADKQTARQSLFRALYGAIKNRYHVGSYRDVRQYDLQDALHFVYNWKDGERL